MVPVVRNSNGSTGKGTKLLINNMEMGFPDDLRRARESTHSRTIRAAVMNTECFIPLKVTENRAPNPY